MKALILAAGLGTRLSPLTNEIPKALVEVNGKPLLQHAIERVKSCGIKDVIINVHHFADKVIDFIENYGDLEINLCISDERDELLDTGGAIKKAEWFLDTGNSFLVYNVDVLSKFDINLLLAAHKQYKVIATLAVSERESSRYLLFNEDNNLAAWQNIKTGEKKVSRVENKQDKYAFSGIYVLGKEIFTYMPEERKFSIIDVLLAAAKEKDVKAFIHESKQILDVGKPESLANAEKFLVQGK